MRTLCLLILSAVSCFGQGALTSGIRGQMFNTITTPVTPSSVKTLFAWYSATNCYTNNGVNMATNDGQSVAFWKDQSASGYNVTNYTFANQGVYRASILNGYPVIQVKRVNAFWNYLFLNTNGPTHHWWIVAYRTNTSLARTWSSTFNAPEGSMIDNLPSTPTYRWLNASGNFSDGYATSNVWTVVESQSGRFSSSGSSLNNAIYIDGKYTRCSTVGRSGVTGIYVGNTYAQNGGIDGMIAEFVLVLGPINEQERVGIGLYLKQKYALQKPF